MAGEARAAFLEAVRQGIGSFAPRGLEYVHHLVLLRARRGAGGPAPAGRFRAVTPAELCQAFQQQAASDFGVLAAHVVRRWGLASGLDLGRAVFLLAEKKCLSMEAGETLDQYAAAGEFRFP